MATFRKRGNKWSFRIDLGRDPVTSERNQVTISRTKDFPDGFYTKKEAQAAAATMQHEYERGTLIQEKEVLFTDLVAEWLKAYAKQVKVSTVRVRMHESGHLMRYFKRDKAKDVTKKKYQAALDDLEERGLAGNTRDGIHSTGRMIFKYAMEQDVIKVDPTQFAKVNKPKRTVDDLEKEGELPKFLEKEELVRFLETARTSGLDGDYEMFTTLAYSGIRDGELCAFKWSDLDFEEHTLSITKTYFNPNNNIKKYELLTPKTNKSIRKIELEPLVFELLKNHQARQNELKMLYRKTYHDKGFVFVNIENYPGYPLYIKFIENRMARLLRIAGLNESLTPHSLRHTHVSLLAEAGVNLEAIMERLGHKDDDTTRHIYMHITKTMKKEASKKFGALLKNV